MAIFKVGDRVRVYTTHEIGTGTVTEINGGLLDVSQDDDGGFFRVHPKQCRRLKPAHARRRIWVNAYTHELGALAFSSKEEAKKVGERAPKATQQVEFIEVRRKKKK